MQPALRPLANASREKRETRLFLKSGCKGTAKILYMQIFRKKTCIFCQKLPNCAKQKLQTMGACGPKLPKIAKNYEGAFRTKTKINPDVGCRPYRTYVFVCYVTLSSKLDDCRISPIHNSASNSQPRQ